MRSLDHPSPMLVPLPTVAPLAQPWSVPSHSFTPPSKAWRPRHAPEKKGGDMEYKWPDRGHNRVLMLRRSVLQLNRWGRGRGRLAVSERGKKEAGAAGHRTERINA